MLERRGGERFFGFEIMIGGEGKAFPLKREVMSSSNAVENRDRSFDDLGSDTIAGNYRDAVLHSNPVGRPHDRQ